MLAELGAKKDIKKKKKKKQEELHKHTNEPQAGWSDASLMEQVDECTIDPSHVS